MRRTTRIGAVLVACVAAAAPLAACSEPTARAWVDEREATWPAVGDPVTVADGDGWRFQVGTDPYDADGTRSSCLQPVIDDTPLGCIPIDAPDAAHRNGTQARVGGKRVIWLGRQTGAIPQIARYVVWSSTSPAGRTIEPIEYDGVQNLLWIMQPGEEPWGFQEILPDGSLYEAVPLVGLPGE